MFQTEIVAVVWIWRYLDMLSRNMWLYLLQVSKCRSSTAAQNLRIVCPAFVAVKEKEDLHPDMESQEINDETFYEYRWAISLDIIHLDCF